MYPGLNAIKASLKTNVQHATKEVNGGWVLELKIPFGDIISGYTAEPGKNIGFDQTVGNRNDASYGGKSGRIRLRDKSKGTYPKTSAFGQFYADPASWANLTFAEEDIYGLPEKAPLDHNVNITVKAPLVLAYDGQSYTITSTPTDLDIKAVDFKSYVLLDKGTVGQLVDGSGVAIADTVIVSSGSKINLTSEDGKVTKVANILFTSDYYIVATTNGILNAGAQSITELPQNLIVSDFITGLTLRSVNSTAVLVNKADSITVNGSEIVNSSMLVKVLSAKGLANYYILDSYFGLLSSTVGELSLPNKFIGKITDGTTVDQLIAGLIYTADVTSVKVYTAANAELLATDAVATGNTLKLSSATKEVSYGLETIIPTVLGLVENFDLPVDLKIWSPSSKMVADNSRKVFVVTQENNAIKVDMQQASFADGQWYKLDKFDMTDTKNRCVSFRCKVDPGFLYDGTVAETVPMKISPWNSKKHPSNRYNAVSYTVKTDGKWAYYFYDLSLPYATAPADADWSLIDGLLLENVVWPSLHAGIFWLDEFRVGNEVAKNPNLTGIKIDGIDLATFDRDILTYIDTLGSTTTTFPAIVASTEDPRATYTVVNSADIKAVGANTVVTGVSADGTVTKVYVINYFIPDVTKDATLATLALNEGTLNPDFNRAIFDYTVVYPIGYESTPVVSASASVSAATVEITQFVNVRSANVAERTATVKVTATDGVTVNVYKIIATVTLATGKSISAYSFSNPAATGVINDNANPRRITVIVPVGTDVTNLVATFTASERATLKVGSVVQQSGVTANNFTTPVDYVVAAEDGATIKYRVTVSFNVGIAENAVQNIKVYPNPTSGNITLNNTSTAGIREITITNMKGQIVRYIKPYQGDLIDVEDLGVGAYNIVVINKDNTSNKLRFIKK